MSKIVNITLKLDDKVTKPLRNVQKKFDGFVNQKFGWSKKVSQSLSGLSKASGFPKIAGATKGVVSSFGNVGKEALKMGAMVGAGVGVAAAGVLALIKQTSAVGDGLVNTAKRIGFGVEAYQEFQYAAEQNGISSDKFAKSMEQIARRVGEAKAGQGALFTFLKKTNPELLKQVTTAKSTEESFSLLMGTLGGMKDATKQAAFSNFLFGESGGRMINIANQGAEGIAALRAEARALGVMTDEEAENANKFGDTLGSLEVAFASVRNVLAVALIPELQVLADQFKAFMMESMPQMREFAKTIAANLPSAIEKAKEAFKGLMDAVSVIINVFKWLGETFGYSNTIIAILVGVIGTGLIGALASATMAVYSLGVAIMTTPLGWILAGVAAVIAAFVLLYRYWDQISSFLKDSWLEIGIVLTMVTGPIGLIVGALLWLWKNWDMVFANIVKAVAKVKDVLPSWLGGNTTAEVNVNNRTQGTDAINSYANTQTMKNESQIKVSFDNLPKGARVDSAGSKNVETDVRMGLMGASTI